MAGSIGDWSRLYDQALMSLHPGGWLEIQEFEVWFYSQTPEGLPEDSAIAQWQKVIDQGSTALGRPLNYAAQYKTHLEEAGYVDIRTQRVKVSKTSGYTFLRDKTPLFSLLFVPSTYSILSRLR
jgi:trans-aconitate methyltransferase